MVPIPARKAIRRKALTGCAYGLHACVNANQQSHLVISPGLLGRNIAE